MAAEEGLKSDVPEWARGDPLMEWYATEVWGKKIDEMTTPCSRS